MSINAYRTTQDVSDGPTQLSIRAVRSILLYCRDWANKDLSQAQKLQAVSAGKQLCDYLIEWVRNDLPEIEQVLLLTIFSETSIDLFDCTLDSTKSLYENERALVALLKILENKS